MNVEAWSIPLAVAVVAVGSLLYTARNHRIADINAYIAALKDERDTLTERVAHLESQVASLEEGMKELKDDNLRLLITLLRDKVGGDTKDET